MCEEFARAGTPEARRSRSGSGDGQNDSVAEVFGCCARNCDW